MRFNFGSLLKHSLFVALTSFALFAPNVLAQEAPPPAEPAPDPNPEPKPSNAPMEASAAIFLGVLGITALLKLRAKQR